MPVTVTMPQLGESVTEGTITRWLKAVGDTVAADEPLLEVSTDKVDTEIPAPASGVLLSIDAAEDDTVEVGGVLAVIGEPDDAAAAPATLVSGGRPRMSHAAKHDRSRSSMSLGWGVRPHTISHPPVSKSGVRLTGRPIDAK